MSTYNLLTKVLTVDGVEIVGAADGDKVVCEPASEYVTQEVGADGAVMQSFTNNRAGQITINMMYGERVNSVLNALKLSGQRFTVSLDDIDGTTLVTGTNCRVQGAPTLTMGMTPSAVTWVLLAERLDIEVGELNDA